MNGAAALGGAIPHSASCSTAYTVHTQGALRPLRCVVTTAPSRTPPRLKAHRDPICLGACACRYCGRYRSNPTGPHTGHPSDARNPGNTTQRRAAPHPRRAAITGAPRAPSLSCSTAHAVHMRYPYTGIGRARLCRHTCDRPAKRAG